MECCVLAACTGGMLMSASDRAPEAERKTDLPSKHLDGANKKMRREADQDEDAASGSRQAESARKAETAKGLLPELRVSGFTTALPETTISGTTKIDEQTFQKID